jgi:hypothetical protein
MVDDDDDDGGRWMMPMDEKKSTCNEPTHRNEQKGKENQF